MMIKWAPKGRSPEFAEDLGRLIRIATAECLGYVLAEGSKPASGL